MATSLPDTVTELHCPNGSTVALVGTAHFSKKSVEDVRRTIQQTRPSVVVLELCAARKVILTYSEDNIKKEAGSLTWQKIRNVINRDGLVAGVTQVIFLKISANLMQKLGVAPGGEFRAGYEEGKRVRSTVILGDRLVDVTFKRALRSLSLWQRLKFVYLLASTLASDTDITVEEMEKMKDKDMVSLLIGELASELPGLSHVFVNERDEILAHSLMKAANCVSTPYGPPVNVVGVVGMGHVTGIEANWMKASDVSHLLVIPPPSRVATILWVSTKLTIMGLFALGAYLIGSRLYRVMISHIPQLGGYLVTLLSWLGIRRHS